MCKCQERKRKEQEKESAHKREAVCLLVTVRKPGVADECGVKNAAAPAEGQDRSGGVRGCRIHQRNRLSEKGKLPQVVWRLFIRLTFSIPLNKSQTPLGGA